jgi:hypothetical protein
VMQPYKLVKTCVPVMKPATSTVWWMVKSTSS